MILSNIEIHKAMDSGKLIISPEPEPRFKDVGVECPFSTHAVDLKLHEEIQVPRGGPFCIDLTQEGSVIDLITLHSQTLILTEKQPYRLEPHDFVLARTLEKVALPKKEQPYLGARIEGKSSRARLGLIVHCTAPTVHPDFEGTLTLEIANLGPATILLVPGMYIAQLIVEEVNGEIVENRSSFQGQTHPSGK